MEQHRNCGSTGASAVCRSIALSPPAASRLRHGPVPSPARFSFAARLGSPVRRVAATLDLTGPSLRGGVQLEYDQYGNRLSLGKTTLETAASRIQLQGDPGKSLRWWSKRGIFTT